MLQQQIIQPAFYIVAPPRVANGATASLLAPALGCTARRDNPPPPERSPAMYSSTLQDRKARLLPGRDGRYPAHSYQPPSRTTRPSCRGRRHQTLCTTPNSPATGPYTQPSPTFP